MSDSPAFDELGPTRPSCGIIQARARKIREFANHAAERAHHGDTERALYWMDRALAEADWRGGDQTGGADR